jgi:Icc-related predicted phosphoesterase
MRILAIGDPHGNLEKIKRIPLKNIDLILLTGDLGKADIARKRSFENSNRIKEGLKKIKEDKKFIRDSHREIHLSTINILKYFSNYAPIYFILGNVGILTKSKIREDKERYGVIIPSTMDKINSMKNTFLVKNRLRQIGKKRIGFLEYFVDSCWVKEFKPGNYKKSMKKAKKQTEKAKRILERFRDLDILVCHQPPYGYLDKVNFKQAPKNWQGKHAGSKTILNYIKKYQPKYVFCGHIHEGEGKVKIGKTEVYNLGLAGHKIIKIN